MLITVKMDTIQHLIHLARFAGYQQGAGDAAEWIEGRLDSDNLSFDKHLIHEILDKIENCDKERSKEVKAFNVFSKRVRDLTGAWLTL